MLPRSGPVPEIPRLTDVEFVGPYDGSGSDQASYLIRRADGRMLAVSPLVYAVGIHIDGERDLHGVALAATTQVGRRVTADNVAYLVQHKLRPLGIVAGNSDPWKPSDKPVLALGLRRALLGRRAVNTVARVLRPLFLPPVVVGVLIGLLIVDGLLLVKTDVIQSVKDVIYQPLFLLVVWAFMALGGIVHELGHATGTRYGGATPGRIGVGIYLLWPAFYNDLTDSYRLSRSGRLRADLGGVYFNAVFVLGLAGGYAATGFTPFLVVIALQHLVIAQQFLPFVRLDGYYVVSDAVGVPDLFARIRPIFSSLIPWRTPDSSVLALTPRAQAAVMVWMLLTVPVLAGSVTLLGVRLPHLVSVARESMAMYATGLSQAAHAGEPWIVLLCAIQLTVLAVPFLGAATVVLRLLRVLLGRMIRAKACSTSGASSPPSALTQARMDRIMAFSLPAHPGPGSPVLSLGFDP